MRQWSKVVTATATAALVALSPGVAVAGNGHGDARPGAAGIGDPYYPKDGNGGYDVTHYDLDLRYAPATDRLSGVATIKARATQDLSRFDLDFVGLRIDSISVNHKQARWNREGQELVIQPARPLRDRKKFTVRIEYAGVPQTIEDPLIGPSGFIHTDDGAIVAGQPHAAATWFPANDHPRDAATFRLDITVPEGLEAISNGVLAHRRTKHGWTTWSWRAEEPMATYLTTLAIGQFQVQDYRADGLRFWDALDPDLFEEPNGNPDGSTYGEVAAGALEHQPEIIRFLESFAGPYPFEAAGGIVDDYPELFFALETQTRPIYSKLFFFDPVFGDDVVVHELAHQWFGDDVRLDGWQHIWLNEGFATYMEFLWFEHEGLATAQQIFEDLTSIPADDPFWDVKTGDPGPADLFDYEAVYLRGALTLHALRLEVGDAAFFRIVERWASTQSGSTVTTAEFVRLAERVSGQQLDDFFRAWLFTAEKPAGLPQAPGAKASAAAASGGAGPVLTRLTAERPRR